MVLGWAEYLTGGTLISLIIKVIKDSMDKGAQQNKLAALEQWKEQCDNNDGVLTLRVHERLQSTCREEVNRDLERIEVSVRELVREMREDRDRISDKFETIRSDLGEVKALLMETLVSA